MSCRFVIKIQEIGDLFVVDWWYLSHRDAPCCQFTRGYYFFLVFLASCFQKTRYCCNILDFEDSPQDVTPDLLCRIRTGHVHSVELEVTENVLLSSLFIACRIIDKEVFLWWLMVWFAWNILQENLKRFKVNPTTGAWNIRPSDY